MRLRVVVYNVRGFRDGPERVTRVAGNARPDLVLLNESGSRRRLRRFTRRLGMQPASDPWSPFRRRVKDAVLVRPPWTILEHRLHRFAGTDPVYPRGAVIARIDRSGRRLWAVSVHLGLRPRERRRNVEELAGLLGGLRDPVVIGGDLNEMPDGGAVAYLAERFPDAWLLGSSLAGETFPADEPTARIDYLFVSDDVEVERVIVPPTSDAQTASDHRPVMAELTLPD